MRKMLVNYSYPWVLISDLSECNYMTMDFAESIHMMREWGTDLLLYTCCWRDENKLGCRLQFLDDGCADICDGISDLRMDFILVKGPIILPKVVPRDVEVDANWKMFAEDESDFEVDVIIGKKGMMMWKLFGMCSLIPV